MVGVATVAVGAGEVAGSDLGEVAASPELGTGPRRIAGFPPPVPGGGDVGLTEPHETEPDRVGPVGGVAGVPRNAFMAAVDGGIDGFAGATPAALGVDVLTGALFAGFELWSIVGGAFALDIALAPRFGARGDVGARPRGDIAFGAAAVDGSGVDTGATTGTCVGSFTSGLGSSGLFSSVSFTSTFTSAFSSGCSSSFFNTSIFCSSFCGSGTATASFDSVAFSGSEFAVASGASPFSPLSVLGESSSFFSSSAFSGLSRSSTFVVKETGAASSFSRTFSGSLLFSSDGITLAVLLLEESLRSSETSEPLRSTEAVGEDEPGCDTFNWDLEAALVAMLLESWPTTEVLGANRLIVVAHGRDYTITSVRRSS